MASYKYDSSREVTPAFLSVVSKWIDTSGEVLVLLRYLGSGAKDYALCKSTGDFLSLVQQAPIGTDIEVFREPQLPIRGLATERLVVRATEALGPAQEYLLVSHERQAQSSLCAVGQMGCVVDLHLEWQSVAGKEIAIGALPDFNAPDSRNLISASKGGLDGPR